MKELIDKYGNLPEILNVLYSFMYIDMREIYHTYEDISSKIETNKIITTSLKDKQISYFFIIKNGFIL